AARPPDPAGPARHLHHRERTAGGAGRRRPLPLRLHLHAAEVRRRHRLAGPAGRNRLRTGMSTPYVLLPVPRSQEEKKGQPLALLVDRLIRELLAAWSRLAQVFHNKTGPLERAKVLFNRTMISDDFTTQPRCDPWPRRKVLIDDPILAAAGRSPVARAGRG